MNEKSFARRDLLRQLGAVGLFFGTLGLAGCKSFRPGPVASTGNQKGHLISEKCTGCGSCKDSCPVEAIKEYKNRFKIDRQTCINCGACVDECPVGAISEMVPRTE